MSYPEDWREEIDLTVEPWKTLAPLCWNCVSPSRLGALAEKHGVSENPYKKPNTRGLFEEGRQHHRDWVAAEKRFGAKLVTKPDSRPQNCGTGHCSCIECPYPKTDWSAA